MAKYTKRTDKGMEVKSKEYPVIYTYIYERESEDIKRLAEKFKKMKPAKSSEKTEPKKIVSFDTDDSGKIVPVYAIPEYGPMVVNEPAFKMRKPAKKGAAAKKAAPAKKSAKK